MFEQDIGFNHVEGTLLSFSSVCTTVLNIVFCDLGRQIVMSFSHCIVKFAFNFIKVNEILAKSHIDSALSEFQWTLYAIQKF